MPKGIRYTDEFKRDAVSQVIDRGYSVQEVADRLGITPKSLYGWKAKFSRPKAETDKDAELRRLKSELARVTEERGILKSEGLENDPVNHFPRTTPLRTSPRKPSEVRFY